MGSIREGHLIALATLAIGLVAVLLGWNGWTTYNATMEGVRGRAGELAQVAERHALQILTEARGLMEVVDLGIAQRGLDRFRDDRDKWLILRALAIAADDVQSVAVADGDGRLVSWSNQFPPPTLSLAGHEVFQVAMATGGVVTGGLRVGILSNQPVFVVGRRLRGGQGAVFVSIDVLRVAGAYAASALPSDSRFGLYGSDGEVLFTHPLKLDQPSANAVTAGALTRTADGRLRADEEVLGRVAALRSVRGAPVIAMATVDPAADVRRWRIAFLGRLAIGVVASLLIGAFTGLAIGQIRREREARTALAILNRGLEAAVAERTRDLSLVIEDQRRAKALAEAATQSKSRFLTAVGHDLRQPLQALRLYQQSLTLKVGDPASVRLLGQMGEAITAAEGLLHSLMEIGRIEAGQVVITPAELSFADLAASLEAQAGDGRLRIVPCRAVLWADRVVLGRILGNLVANAIRHGRGGRVLVGCRRAAGGGARLVVCDQGGGIPPDKLDAIFEEFYQLDNASRSRDKGFGLGLSIARRLAAASGFGMSVASTGRGSTFTVHLPPQAVADWSVVGFNPAARPPQAT